MSEARVPSTADVVVVGAGVMGSAIALELVRRRAGRVLVLDARHAGEGMSARSSALVRMHYTFRPEVELAVLGLRRYREWPEWVGAPTLLRHTGFVRFVGPGETDRLRANCAMQRECGAEVDLVGGEALRRLLPGWRIDDVELAAYEPNGAYGDGARAAGDMLARARALGAEYRAQVRVTQLGRQGDRIVGVETASGTVASPLVICATGPWTPRLLDPLGCRLPITTALHAVAIVRHPGLAPPARPACIDSASRTYFRPDGDGSSLIGDFSGPRGVDPDDFPQHPRMDALADLVERAATRVPALAEGGIARGYTGVYDMTPDARPLIGHAPDLEGAIVACGFSGMGFKIAPAIGVVVAELVLDGRATTVDISAFDPDRFRRGEPIRAPFEYQDD